MGWTAARWLGLKLILLAASFAALGSTLAPAPGLAEATWAGMKLIHLILGMFGAGASLFFLPQFTLRWLGATVTCGLLCAAAGTPFLAWAYTAYFDKAALPGPLENVVAVGLGIAGVSIIPAIQRAADQMRANPWGFLVWMRSGAAGPPPAAPDDKGGGK